MHLKWSILFYIELETTAKYQSILNEKMKFSIKNFFSKCDTADLVTFTEEIVNGRLFFLCSNFKSNWYPKASEYYRPSKAIIS